MKHPIQQILNSRASRRYKGIASLCTANSVVIESAMDRYKSIDYPLLIESTANQVNQDGGYTGLTPKMFARFVHDLAKKVGFPRGRLVLGGDHLGPLIWKHLPEEEAMIKAEELVRDYVLAGFTKIHLDTSMRLASDEKNTPLNVIVVARRGIRLMKIAEEAFVQRRLEDKDALAPVYVIGSEVPIPGGAKSEESIEVTSPDDLLETILVYKNVMKENELEGVLERVIAVVVQPGVEFGNNTIHDYDPINASQLCKALSMIPGIVFEGHSTDYQTSSSLAKMVNDGIAILKVGPALTFALRESLYALSYIEKELRPNVESNFIETLDNVMIDHPEIWMSYCHGNENERILSRRFGYSDRIRYALNFPSVEGAMRTLLMNTEEIPLSLLSQFMPYQYRQVREKRLSSKPIELLKASVGLTIDDYLLACGVIERT